MSIQMFSGCMPALMTPCSDVGAPNFDILVEEGKALIEAGMSAVIYCGATGAITGIGNALPQEVLLLTRLCERAQRGDAQARMKVKELDAALQVLSSFDEGPDLVLYYKHSMVLNGKSAYRHHFNPDDRLSSSQKSYLESQYELFKSWFADWSKQGGVIAHCM